MNMNFKLGKVSIPVDVEAGVNVTVEGLEVSVSDYNLMEGLKVVQAMPKVLREMKAIVEGEDAPSAGKVEEVEEDGPEYGFVHHPLFGGIKVVKGQNPFEKLQKIAEDVMKEKEEQGGKLPWEKPVLKEMSLDDLLGKVFGKKM